jgi:nucleoside-diphosphate-sugar epimerase
VSAIGGKKLIKRHIDGPTGVRGRCSDNRLIAEQLGWKPAENLEHGLTVTYDWISAQLNVGLRQLESSDR